MAKEKLTKQIQEEVTEEIGYYIERIAAIGKELDRVFDIQDIQDNCKCAIWHLRNIQEHLAGKETKYRKKFQKSLEVVNGKYGQTFQNLADK